jgi:hypothetical protein
MINKKQKHNIYLSIATFASILLGIVCIPTVAYADVITEEECYPAVRTNLLISHR